MHVVVCGAGIAGLGAALLLARAGCTVTVLEADPDGAPEDPAQAWERWERAGVAQFHQPHTLLARFRQVLADELPDVLAALRDAGCLEVDPLASLPPGITDREPREGDERLRMLAGRRPVVEGVLAAAAGREPGVAVRRGVRVAGLTTGTEALPGSPHVTGVRLRDGEELPADLVVDATGRRTRSTDWLAAVGAWVPAPTSSGRGFVYYTRYFTGPDRPRLRGPANTARGSINLLALEGDARTWSLTVFALSADRPLKALRQPEVFDRVVRAFPLAAPLVEGTPLTGVLPMAGVLNTRRELVVEGRPVVTGFASLSDAWACTNPSGGRGLSVGLVHGQLLRDLVVACGADPAGFATAWAERTDEVVGPFYRAQCAADDARIAEMAAVARGEQLPPPADGGPAAFAAAAMHDADLFRALLETTTCTAHAHEVLARPRVRERLAAVGPVEPLRIPGPDRARLLELVAA